MSIKRVGKRFLKWGGPVVAVLLAAAWWMSDWRWIGYLGPGGSFCVVERGVIGVGYGPEWATPRDGKTRDAPPTGFHGGSVPLEYEWWFVLVWEPGHRAVGVPLWFPVGIVVGLSTVVWRRDWLSQRRAILGHCAKCRYDRRGLAAAAPCPECGATEQVR